MASPSSCALMEPGQVQFLNQILDDENIDEFNLADDRIFASVYIQSVTPGTHVISDNESDNSGNEQEENINKALGHHISLCGKTQAHFPLHKKHFMMCMVPKFYSAELDVMNKF
jgi:hypothetical protein